MLRIVDDIDKRRDYSDMIDNDYRDAQEDNRDVIDHDDSHFVGDLGKNRSRDTVVPEV